VGKRKDGRLEDYGELSYDDIAGQERAKQEVSEICLMLKNPEKYNNVGARLPAGE
jgi:cell division protease FtsH